jgi:hypothetical protein
MMHPSRVRALPRTIARFATMERIRIYGLMMAVPYLLLALLSLQSMTLGSGFRDSFDNVIGGDFLAFYTGAHFFLADRLPEVYDLEVQRSFQDSVVGLREDKGMHPFLNPPFAVLLYAPFKFLGYRADLFLWIVVGGFLLFLSAWLIRSELSNLDRYSVLTLSLGSFLFYPTVAWFRYAQATPFILLLYAGTFVLMRRRRDAWAGFCLGCLAFKPQLAFVLALVLLMKLRWRALLGGATSATCWIIAGFLVSPSAMWTYLEVAPELTNVLRWDAYPTWGVNTFFGFSVLLLESFSPAAANLLWGAMTLTCLVLLAWAWSRTPWEPGTRCWDLTMAATIIWGLLISPHLYIYDVMLLLLPLAIVWNHFPGRDELLQADGGSLLSWSLLVWVLGAYGSVLSIGQENLTEWLEIPNVGIQVLVLVILFWGWTVLRLSHTQPMSSPTLTYRA